MPKRILDDDLPAPQAKKTRFTDSNDDGNIKDQRTPVSSKLTAEEIDFPRGGGTSFTPIEVKAIRAEALQEADSELFEVRKF